MSVLNLTLKWYMKNCVPKAIAQMSPHGHSAGSTEAAPCRSCSSFAEYMKQNRPKFSSDDSNTGEVSNEKETFVRTRDDCPLDRSELGLSTWQFLHTMAAKYPDNPTLNEKKDMKTFMSLFAKFYPCRLCAEDFKKQILQDPPITDSQHAFSQWLCRMHNKVNLKLGKPEYDCSKIDERWRDGWMDGSCG